MDDDALGEDAAPLLVRNGGMTTRFLPEGEFETVGAPDCDFDATGDDFVFVAADATTEGSSDCNC